MCIRDSHWGIGITVSRQIHKIQFIINIVKINSLRFPRLRRSPRLIFTIHKSVNQRRFSDITFSRKRNFRQTIFRKRTGNATDRLQIYTFYNHNALFSFIILRFTLWKDILFPGHD